jgi:molybdate transport system substrate-binding protein
LSIAAASDLRYALDDVAAAYDRAGGAAVAVSYGSSGNFFAQIVNGAPFDLFLSADIAYARELDERGLVAADGVFGYARGRLAVWTRKSSSLDVGRGLEALADPAVGRIAIANPAHAPYGRAAEAALRSAGVLDRVRPKIVLGENISQALQFAQSGAADAGLVALSLVLAPPVAGEGKHWLVPGSLHAPILQGGAVLKSPRSDQAARFRDFLLGAEAQAVLRRYGFEAADAAPVHGHEGASR